MILAETVFHLLFFAAFWALWQHNCLAAPDATSSGSLRLNGVEIAGQKERDLVRLRRVNIGFVFKQFYLMPTLTARGNIELTLLFSRKRGSAKRIKRTYCRCGAWPVGAITCQDSYHAAR